MRSYTESSFWAGRLCRWNLPSCFFHVDSNQFVLNCRGRKNARGIEIGIPFHRKWYPRLHRNSDTHHKFLSVYIFIYMDNLYIDMHNLGAYTSW